MSRVASPGVGRNKVGPLRLGMIAVGLLVVFRQHYETDELDASLLLLLLMGFLPPSDERIRATVLAIADELTKDGLVLRYRVEGTDTGYKGEEGTFTICSFWLVSALALIGERDRAHALCQKLLSFGGPLLLYAEEIDTTTGEHLGNFPQAFTHLALIEAVLLLIASESREVSAWESEVAKDPRR
jgi:GH15 family glucan-1,4-alpha-glucosidase